jgi:hypothetical protein
VQLSLQWKSNKHNIFCESVALVSAGAAPIRVVICDVIVSTIFFHIISKRHDLRKKKLLNTKCVL